MKHILKSTAIGGMIMLRCFALEAMDIKSNIPQKITVSGNKYGFSWKRIYSVEELKRIDSSALEKLSIECVNVESLEDLPVFPNVKELTVSECHIGSFGFLSHFPALSFLHLNKTPVCFIRQIPDLASLEDMLIFQCELRSVENFPNLPALNTAAFWTNDISIEEVVELSKKLPNCIFTFVEKEFNSFCDCRKIENGIVGPCFKE